LDRGPLGIALDPSFSTRGVVYAPYTYDAPIRGTAPVYNDACADPTGAGCNVSGRLSRILADGSEQVMIEVWCQQNAIRQERSAIVSDSARRRGWSFYPRSCCDFGGTRNAAVLSPWIHKLRLRTLRDHRGWRQG
jgi:hypothetical protein